MGSELKIRSFQDLYDLSQKYRKGHWVFRGVARLDFQLIPKIGRPPIETSNERRVLDFFIREAVPYIRDIPQSEWEWLAIAQHHGLPTRLLDWTENPLVAAFFACSEHEDADAAFYILRVEKRINQDDYEKSPFIYPYIARYRPRHITRRISSQRGLFTIQPDPSKPIELSNTEPVILHRAIIEHSFKRKLRWNLSRFGIHRHSLFPDLDGLTSHITWMFSDDDPSDEPLA